MSEVLLDTHDLDEAESMLSSLYSETRLSASPDPPGRFRIQETGTGPLTVHDLDYGADFAYDAEPFERLVLLQADTGVLEQRLPGMPPAVVGPGAVTAVGACGVPFSGVVRTGRYSLLVLSPGSLQEFAPPGQSVRLTGVEPISAQANRHLGSVVSYVKQVAGTALSGDAPLLASELRRHVAATVLATFPNTTRADATAAERRGGTPRNMLRAITFIDDNASRDVSLADIAASISVTPRALQYMFRKHRDCTPLDYLRRVRLRHAHEELIAGDPAATSVSEIARRWGFGHAGRFAGFHRDQYGESPYFTLRRRS